eukprot:5583641-Ditylum_brightwellii.AAC.1
MKSSLNRHESWLYYTSCYLKSIGYVLGQTFLPKKDLKDIDHHVVQAFKSKHGYNRNMPYAIHDGPSHLGGAEFTPLYHLQGIQQV